MERAFGRVDRDLVEIGRAQPRLLRVEVGEESALQQRIVAEIDAGDDVRRQEGDLLGLGEEIVDVAVERHAADDLDGDIFLGDQLGRIEHVVRLLLRKGFVKDLHAQIPRREVARVDRLEQVAAVEIGIGARDLDRFVPCRRLDAEHRFPVEFDEFPLAFFIDEAEGVDAEPLDHAQAARDRTVGHRPHDHVHRLGHQPDEIPESVVRARRLRIAAVGLHLDAMNEVGKFHRVLNEEDRNVVAHEIPVAAIRIELDRKAAHVARGVDRARAAGNGRESDAFVSPGIALVHSKTPCAPDPRAWTIRSGMRSWSKWKIFSRRTKSSSSVGPRSPARSEFWLSEMRWPKLSVR